MLEHQLSLYWVLLFCFFKSPGMNRCELLSPSGLPGAGFTEHSVRRRAIVSLKLKRVEIQLVARKLRIGKITKNRDQVKGKHCFA